ncbi:MAG: hypothetical protein O3C49_00070, partial [Proteobacteria bacterium]|nr:hypothetical protein [Pseudomonadota bacterium]
AYAKENLEAKDVMWYGVGAVYSMTKVDKVSAGWGHGETQDGLAGAVDTENDIITIGWSRDLGKGISFAGSGFYSEEELGTSAKNPKGYGLVAGIRMTF